MKNKKVIIIVVVCILLIAATVGGLYLFKKPTTGTDTTAPGGTTGSTGTTGTATDSFPLQMGSKGNNVKLLQAKMNQWMTDNWSRLITIKPRHQNGLLAGQVMSSISVDGNFGANTREFCGFIFGTTSVTESQFSSMTASGWGGGTSSGNGTTSTWDDSQVPDKTADQSWWDYWVANIGTYFI